MPHAGKLYVPVITPLMPDGVCDTQALATLSKNALQEGADGVVLFGTLGEGQSFSVGERKAALEALVSSGVRADRIIVGTGAAALPDAVELTRHALGIGVERSLVLVPFFFKGVSDRGIEDAIAQLIDAVGDTRMRLYLYDIPSVVGVAIAPAVIASLWKRYGAIIAGIKDSVADWAHVENSLKSFPNLEVFVGNEIFIPKALELGGAGAISGHGNIATRQLVALCKGETGRSGKLFASVETLYHAIARYPVIPTVKALAAHRHANPDYAAVRAPLVRLDLSAAPEVVKTLDDLLAE